MSRPPTGIGAPDQLVSDWVEFGNDGTVTVFTGRVELGQGNLTALLQIAADELCLPPAKITIIPADTARTPDEGYTAGSMSVSVGGMVLRKATSAARMLILREAARRLNTAAEDLSVVNGTIQHRGQPSGHDLRSLALDVDLNVPIADHAAPLPRGQRVHAGTSLPRIDLPGRVLGTPFVHDLRPKGVLHGRVIRPAAAQARLVSVDLDALKQRPGVVETVRDGSFLGLLATSSWDAVRAQDWALKNTEWSDPPAPAAPPLDIVRNTDTAVETVHDSGEAHAAEGREFSLTATRPNLSHGSIGPSAALAVWRDGRLTVQTHSQGVFPLRAAMATVLGLDPQMITVTHTPGAGCYGHNGADDAAMDAALLARAVPGRPVLVVWSRAEEFRAAPLGPMMATTAKAMLDATGQIGRIEVTVNSAPHVNRPGAHGAPNLLAGAQIDPPFPFPVPKDLPLQRGGGADRNAIPYYDIPAMRVDKRLVHDLPYRTSSLRGLGATVNVFAIESLFNHIAAETGQDPAELRCAHLDDPRARAVIERVMQSSAAQRSQSEGVGWGLAFARYKNSAAYAAIVAQVDVTVDVRVTHVWAAIDAGEVINPDGLINQTEGGILQSTSWALKEQLAVDGAAVEAENWEEYPILKFSEVPDIQVDLVDQQDAPPLGCAEAVQGPVVAAISEAIHSAIGARLTDMPFTYDRIVTALM